MASATARAVPGEVAGRQITGRLLIGGKHLPGKGNEFGRRGGAGGFGADAIHVNAAAVADQPAQHRAAKEVRQAKIEVSLALRPLQDQQRERRCGDVTFRFHSWLQSMLECLQEFNQIIELILCHIINHSMFIFLTVFRPYLLQRGSTSVM